MRLAIHRRESGDITEGPDRAADDPRAVRLAAILDELDPALAREHRDLVGLRGLADRVNQHDSRDIRPKALAHLLDANVIAIGLAVAELRFEPVQNDRAERPRISDRRDQDLAAFRQFERRDRDVERRGTRRDGVGMTAAHHRNERIGVHLLERALIARINLLVAVIGDALFDHAQLRLAKSKTWRHRIFSYGLSAFDGELTFGNTDVVHDVRRGRRRGEFAVR